MKTVPLSIEEWQKERIKEEEIMPFLKEGGDFIKEDLIRKAVNKDYKPDKKRLEEILAKALAIETLSLEELSYLMSLKDPQSWARMEEAALAIKRRVYNNRIVTFAPLYLGNFCVNSCLYCGFRKENSQIERKILSRAEIEQEIEVLAGEIGHKRLIVVYGEHPQTDLSYIKESIETIYKVKVKTKNGWGQIRRVNVNAPPLNLEELRELKKVGLGTYQVFQETYHHATYKRVHPTGTIKHNYLWRLYTMHRAFKAGIDDVGIGVLFGLYDWRFEVMALLLHARELEKEFGIGPHTVSFPRLEPALNTPFASGSSWRLSDEDFRKVVILIRLSIPYTGMIITAREPKRIREESLRWGITQTDASSRIGIGSYKQGVMRQEEKKQQFILGDERSLDELVGDLADKGIITSFCTAGYRCGRTGKRIMELLRSGQEGIFCKLNAILTFREWIDDFASNSTYQKALLLLEKEREEVRCRYGQYFPLLEEYYRRISRGERDLFF